MCDLCCVSFIHPETVGRTLGKGSALQSTCYFFRFPPRLLRPPDLRDFGIG